MTRKNGNHTLWLAAFLLVSSTLFAAGCAAKFNKSASSSNSSSNPTAPVIPSIFGQNFNREVAGGTSIATSSSYKLKGVSIGGVVNHNASGINYKTTDEASGAVK